MSETSNKEARPPRRVSLLTGTLVILVAIILLYVWFGAIFPPNVASLARRVRCRSNLRQLGMMLVAYAEDNHGVYPRHQAWCDVLVAEHGDKDVNDVLLCLEERMRQGRAVTR